MAIYHCSVKNIGRSGGKSAVASASYRSGEELYSEELGLSFDYTRKQGVEYSEIILCQNAPREYQDRATLWNAVEQVEKASDARLAREWEVAIPRELSLEEGQALVRGFAQSLADEGMCVDFAIHDKGDGNRHAHIMGTTRPIKENGEWGAKEKKAYKLDEHGEKIPVIDPKTGEQKIGARGRKIWQRETVEANDWNRTEKIEEWRERWANECNRYLEKEQQIDHRSYARQGIDQVPTIHEGYQARQIEEKGGVSELCQTNREIREYNNLWEKFKESVKDYAREIIDRFRGNHRAVDTSREAPDRERELADRERQLETRSQARQLLNTRADERSAEPEERELRFENVRKSIGEREQQIEQREPIANKSEQQIDSLGEQLARLQERVSELAKEKERRIRERLEQLKLRRAVDGTARDNASGNREAQEQQRTAPEGQRQAPERSIEERLASLQSRRASREGRADDTDAFIRNIETKVSSAENGRAEREAERSRQAREAERRAREEQQRLAKENAERIARHRDHGLSR